jgi:hypothetical protein
MPIRMDSACEAGFTKGCRDFLNRQEPTDEPNRIKSSLCAHKGGDMLLVVAEMVIHNRPFLADYYQNPGMRSDGGGKDDRDHGSGNDFGSGANDCDRDSGRVAGFDRARPPSTLGVAAVGV